MDKDAIVNQLKKDEGFSPKSFWDNKQWTYGYGCCAPSKGVTISEVNATIMLSKRVDQAIEEYYDIFEYQPINDNRQGALVNMIFNLGKQGVINFHHMIAAIKIDNWKEAAEQAKDSLWYRQLKNSGDPPGRANRIVAELKKRN
jgi:GH24 family phage-related lysozyme (muramidase)